MSDCRADGHFDGLNVAFECSCEEMTSAYFKNTEGWATVPCHSCGKEYEFRATMFAEMREKHEQKV